MTAMTQPFISRQYVQISPVTRGEGAKRSTSGSLLELTLATLDGLSDHDTYRITVRDLVGSGADIDDPVREYCVRLPKGNCQTTGFTVESTGNAQRKYDVMFSSMPSTSLVHLFETRAPDSVSVVTPGTSGLSSWNVRSADDHVVLQALSGSYSADASQDSLSILAPIPGRVSNIMVSVGDKVCSGQPMIGLEAMKMENVLKSAQSGFVERINVTVNDRVESGTILISLSENYPT